jgi:hypothetical protein
MRVQLQQRRLFPPLGIALLILLSVAASSLASAQKDSLVFSNGDAIIGEISGLRNGVLTIETDYSDSDFQIDWDEVRQIFSDTHFFVVLEDRKNYIGQLSSGSDLRVTITTEDAGVIECELQEIVYLETVEESFWDRLDASVDVGFSLTKAQNQRQLTINAALGYKTESWSTLLKLGSLRSTQDNTEKIDRQEGDLTGWYILPRQWYLSVSVSVLSSTEQKLDLRVNGRISFGKFLVWTSSTYWGVLIGGNRNNERYSDETPNRASWEGYLGTELNLYDVADVDLLAKLDAYPGLTEPKRFRADFNLDAKFDLPLDFYINVGFAANYDNKPAEGADKIDYVLKSGLGWEL